VALLPGTNFGAAGAGHVRLCYATDRRRISEGIRRMKQCLRSGGH